jgi:hypothetical protein
VDVIVALQQLDWLKNPVYAVAGKPTQQTEEQVRQIDDGEEQRDRAPNSNEAWTQAVRDENLSSCSSTTPSTRSIRRIH